MSPTARYETLVSADSTGRLPIHSHSYCRIAEDFCPQEYNLLPKSAQAKLVANDKGRSHQQPEPPLRLGMEFEVAGRLVVGLCEDETLEAARRSRLPMVPQTQPNPVGLPPTATIPELQQSKTAVLNTLASQHSRRSYEYAIDRFIAWYCSEPRLEFNRSVVCEIPLIPGAPLPVRSYDQPASFCDPEAG